MMPSSLFVLVAIVVGCVALFLAALALCTRGEAIWWLRHIALGLPPNSTVQLHSWGAPPHTPRHGDETGAFWKEGFATLDATKQANPGTLAIYANADRKRQVFGLYEEKVFVDLEGMNVLERDIDPKHSNIPTLAVTTRTGKRYLFRSKDTLTPCITSNFFGNASLADGKGTNMPFLMNMRFSGDTALQLLYVPYKSNVSNVDTTFIALWKVSDGGDSELMRVMFTAKESTQSGSDVITHYAQFANDTHNPFPLAPAQKTNAESQGAYAAHYQPATNGGLAYIFGRDVPLPNLATNIQNWISFSDPGIVKSEHYYFYATDTDRTHKTKSYPQLYSLTPFVYYNAANGDLLVATGALDVRTTEEGTTHAQVEASAIGTYRWVRNGGIDTSLPATAQLRRFKRPQDADVWMDEKPGQTTTLQYDEFVKDTNDQYRYGSTRKEANAVNTHSIPQDYPPTAGVKMLVCASPIERRVVYYAAFDRITVLTVLAYSASDKRLVAEKVRVFDSGMYQDLAGWAHDTTVTSAELSKYQSATALTGTAFDISNDSAAAAAAAADDDAGDTDTAKLLKKKQQAAAAAAALAAESGSGGMSKALSDLERRAMYDAIAAIFYSRHATSTAAGYTTLGCPSCFINGGSGTAAGGSGGGGSAASSSSSSSMTTTTTTTAAAAAAAAAEADPHINPQATPAPTDTDPWQSLRGAPAPPLPTQLQQQQQQQQQQQGSPPPPPTADPAVFASPGAAAQTSGSGMFSGFRRVPDPRYVQPMPIAFDLSGFSRRS